MNGDTIAFLPGTVPPGYPVDRPVDLVAPWTPGPYVGFWHLRSSEGHAFGIGPNADQPFWVSIDVSDASVQKGFDFTTSACSAGWNTTINQLSCPGNHISRNDSIIPTDSPKLEIGNDDEPTIWLHPNESMDGSVVYIHGWKSEMVTIYSPGSAVWLDMTDVRLQLV